MNKKNLKMKMEIDSQYQKDYVEVVLPETNWVSTFPKEMYNRLCKKAEKEGISLTEALTK